MDVDPDPIEALSTLTYEQRYVFVATEYVGLTEGEVGGCLERRFGSSYSRNRVHRLKLTARDRLIRYLAGRSAA